MIHALLVLIAVFFDYLLGEPKRYHPLAGFGRLAVMLEGMLYGTTTPPGAYLRLAGLFAWVMLIAPFVLLSAWLASIPMLGYGFEVLFLYLALGASSLALHARTVAHALKQRRLNFAREHVAMMVSRETKELDETGVSRATIESVLENGNDAIFAALFWFTVLGAPGVVMYRLANTLDAMWGYRDDRYRYFGWASARIDDLLNWVPARLTALTYILVGRTRQGLRCWRRQAPQWYGMNPGVVMSSGAGAMNVTLGGAARYHGQLKQRPLLGAGQAPTVEDIERSVLFVQRGQWLWLAVIFCGAWAIA